MASDPQIKKRWSKGLVVSDKMDKSVAVLVERWAEAWDGAPPLCLPCSML